MPFLSFQPVKRPEPVEPDYTLDEKILEAAEDAELTLYFVNMVVVKATKLVNADTAIVDKSDPYCVVSVGNVSDRTDVVENELNPVWNKKMHFFVKEKPSQMTLEIWDEDANSRDDTIGKAEFDFGSFFDIDGSYEGDLDVIEPNGEKKGTVTIALKCSTLKPVETEIKLGYAEKQLGWKEIERKNTVSALDESEELRKGVIDELSKKEQEVIKQAEDIAEKQHLHKQELTGKEQEVLEKAQIIEEKVREMEQIEIAKREIELEKAAAETKLTEAENGIIEQAKKLKQKEEENAEALSEKEKEVLEMAKKLEEKDEANRHFENQLNRVEALKVEVQNELTIKEQLIKDQAEKLEAMAKEHSEILTSKEKEIIEQGKALEEREKRAQDAQNKQDKTVAELGTMKQKLEEKEKLIKQQEAQLEELKKLNEASAGCGECMMM